MKKHFRLLTLLSLVAALSAGSAMAQNGSYRLGKVLGLRYFKLAKGDAAAYEQRVKDIEYPFWDDHTPGVDLVLMKGDRGARNGEYTWFFNIVDLDRRNHYWPTEQGPWPNYDPITEKYNEDVAGHFSDFELEAEGVGDYVLVGGETMGEMPWIDLLGIHHIRVKPGQEAAFERFVAEKWNPVAHIRGAWILVYKADRGARNGDYALVWAFEDRSLRTTYYPVAGDGSSAAYQQAFAPVQSNWDELAEFLDDPVETEYTDFVMVR